MKVNYKKRAAYISVVCCLLFTISIISSCKKLVSIDLPENEITTTTVFSSNATANAALAGLYSQMMTNTGNSVLSNGGLTLYAGLSSDEFVSYVGVANAIQYQFESNTLQMSGSTISNGTIDPVFWQPTYHIINIANSIIENSASSTSVSLTDSARRELTAECKFVRAFHYFYLTNLFGDVPLVTTTDYQTTALMARTPQATVYKQIIQDLLDAQANLPINYSVVVNGERIRPNKWAATALLARVYLYQKDWADAETQASAVIANSQYSLTNLAGVFVKNSAETIWSLQGNTGTSATSGGTFDPKYFVPTFLWSAQTAGNQAAFFSSFNVYASYLLPSYYMTTQLANAFEPNDNRKTAWTQYVPTPAAAPYFGVTKYFPYKYTQVSGTVGASPSQYYVVLRLAEQYLIRAEARAQLNESGAATDLNAIRTRAGLPGTTAVTQSDLLAAVAHERQVELFAEFGHRWFDLKRTGRATAVLSAITTKQPWNDYQLLYPIPYTEFKADPFLTQNPGY